MPSHFSAETVKQEKLNNYYLKNFIKQQIKITNSFYKIRFKMEYAKHTPF